jgi:hypothetical protein
LLAPTSFKSAFSVSEMLPPSELDAKLNSSN